MPARTTLIRVTATGRGGQVQLGLGSGVAGGKDDSGAVVEFDRGKQRAGEEGLPYLALFGVLLRGPFRGGGHVIDHEQAMRAERGDRAIEAGPFAALGIGEYQVKRPGLAKHAERVAHPQVNELWPGAAGGQGRCLRVLFNGGHRDISPGQQPPGNPGRAYPCASSEFQDAGACRQVRGQDSQQLPDGGLAGEPEPGRAGPAGGGGDERRRGAPHDRST